MAKKKKKKKSWGTVEGNKGVVVNENETLFSQSREGKLVEFGIRELGG